MADAPSSASSSTKKRSFDAAFKLRVVEYAEANTNRGAGRKFGVDEKRVREWKKQKCDLEGLGAKKKRLEGGGRKVAFPQMEEELAGWIEGLRAQNFRVTRKIVRIKALELAQSK